VPGGLMRLADRGETPGERGDLVSACEFGQIESHGFGEGGHGFPAPGVAPGGKVGPVGAVGAAGIFGFGGKEILAGFRHGFVRDGQLSRSEREVRHGGYGSTDWSPIPCPYRNLYMSYKLWYLK
jgi:hypothetical protein